MIHTNTILIDNWNDTTDPISVELDIPSPRSFFTTVEFRSSTSRIKLKWQDLLDAVSILSEIEKAKEL